MSLGTDLPFHDRTGMPEHMRGFSHLTLSERERIAFAAGDHATVALIHATEEECAREAGRVRTCATCKACSGTKREGQAWRIGAPTMERGHTRFQNCGEDESASVDRAPMASHYRRTAVTRLTRAVLWLAGIAIALALLARLIRPPHKPRRRFEHE